MRVCIVHEGSRSDPPSFIRAHIERIPGPVSVVHGFVPHIEGAPVLSQGVGSRAWRKGVRYLTRRSWNWELTSAYIKALRLLQPDVVLAEFGPTAVRVLDACVHERIPLVAHFHGGFDVGSTSVRNEHQGAYQRLLASAAEVVAVSKEMQQTLVSMGASAEKCHHIVCGVDHHLFSCAEPGAAPPVFVAVGQFIDFKAPHLTLLAFANVRSEMPEARLCMIGAGPLLECCRDIARALALEDSVEFLGQQPHSVVQKKVCSSRAFVQHSIHAASGNCEGTPVAIMEASTAGLPVIATRHAGILDVVVEGVTGILVDEYDVAGMARAMLRLARDRDLARSMGASGRDLALANFTLEKTIGQLSEVLQAAVGQRGT